LEAETEEGAAATIEAAAVVKVAATVKTAATMAEMVEADITDGKGGGNDGRDGGSRCY
jgi:hypothetical protein